MRKQKLALLTFLVAMLSACCILFAVGCSKAPKHEIKWTVDEHATVKVADYDEPPTELAEDTVVNFTISFDTGYELGTVSGGGVKASGDGYTFTVGSKDVEIKVTSVRTITSLEVTNEVETYYAGEAVDPETVSVKVNYAVGDAETVTGDKCTFVYQNGDAFSLGDTKYTVKYNRGSADIEFDEAVVGLVKLNLEGGTISATDLAKLPEGAEQANGAVTWTFTKAVAADINLPTPTRLLDPKDDTSALPFERWSGVDGNKIAAGTETSVTATAVYETTLVNVTKMEFTTKAGVPYLAISGEFKAAKSAYLFLCEGNEHIKYDKETPAVKQESGNTFTLELNLAEYAQATPAAFETEKPVTATSFKGAWMDLRFCVKLGETIVQQELFVSDDVTYANLYDSLAAKVGENWYRFSYKTWSPKAGDPITGGNGAVFTGEENILKLIYEDCPDVVVNYAELQVKDNVAYLVLNGQYVDKTGEATKADVEAVIKKLVDSSKDANDCSIEGYSYWDRATTTKSYTLKDDFSWTISFALDGTQHDHGYYVHFQDSNLTAATKPETVKAGNFEYTLCNDAGTDNWTSGLVWVNVVDVTKPVLKLNTVALEQDGDKVSLVYSGVYKNYTKAQLEKYAIDIEGNGRQLLDLKLAVDEENGTFTLTADISDTTKYPASGFYYMHGALLEEGKTLADLGESGNIKAGACAIAEGKGTVTVNKITYTLGEQWGTRGVMIEAEAAE